MNTTLCQHCQAISLDDEKLGGTAVTHKDGKPFLSFGEGVEGAKGRFSLKIPGYHEDELPGLPGLQLSAINGCKFCGLLRSAVLSEALPQEVNREDPDTSNKILIRFEDFEYRWHSLHYSSDQKGSLAYLAFLSVATAVKNQDGRLYHKKIIFEVCAPQGPLATWLRIPCNIADDNALSPDRIRDIKSWISDCEQNCDHGNITKALPTRLIDVGFEDGKDQVRLILSFDIPKIRRSPKSCRYTTLSYCWGNPTDGQAFTTQRSTLQQLLQSIPMEWLPSTCRDAVTVTRRLGIRYLWIDALCIVQDDPEDWAKESAIMGQIYTNSWLTLIALRGESCHDGLLDRKTAMKAPIYYKSSLDPYFNGIYWLRHATNDYAQMRRMYGTFGAVSHELVKSRWKSRGWTFQEEQLSTRKLMFGTDKMYYNCGTILRTETADECPTITPWSKPFSDVSNNSTDKDLFCLWYETVGSYGHRGLTYPTDRLPAISGLALTVHSRTDRKYLAGLWKSDLFDGLLWIRSPWKRPAVMSGATFIKNIIHPKHYIAPSWSWARSQQEIRFICNLSPHPKNASDIKVLEATTVLTGSNRFGGVQSGHLRLQGKTFRLKGGRISRHDGTEVKRLEWLQGSIWHETINYNGLEIARCALDWKFPSQSAMSLDLCQAPWDQLMMLITASHSVEDWKDWKDWGDDDENNFSERRNRYGLLLLPTTRQAESWIRVGVFILWGDKQGRAVFKNFCREDVKLV